MGSKPTESPEIPKLVGTNYRLWVSDDGKVLVRLWADDRVEVATRENSWETWGPPVYLNEEVW